MLTTWHDPHSPTACHCWAAINQYRQHTGPTPAILQQQVCCCGPMLGQTNGQTNGKMDRQTDGWTPYHYKDPALHTMWQAVPIIQNHLSAETVDKADSCFIGGGGKVVENRLITDAFSRSRASRISSKFSYFSAWTSCSRYSSSSWRHSQHTDIQFNISTHIAHMVSQRANLRHGQMLGEKMARWV